MRDAELPAAFVDLDAFDAFAVAMLRRAGDRPIRVATKSVRSVPLLRRVLESDLDAVGAALARGATITPMVDDAAHLAALASVAQDHQVTIGVCLEIDVSQQYPGLRFGSYRSPLRPPVEVVAFADLVASTAGPGRAWPDGVRGPTGRGR